MDSQPSAGVPPRARAAAGRLRRRRSLTAVHIVASVGLLGSTLAMLLSAVAAARSTDPVFSHSAYTLMRTQVSVFGIPLSFIALTSGVALGRDTKWGVVRYWWTAAKLVLLVLSIACGAAIIGPALAGRLRGAGEGWGLVAAVAANAAMLLFASFISVFKPGGRLRRAPRVAGRVERRTGPPIEG